MKDTEQKTNGTVMRLDKERPFPELTDIPEGWYKKDHWILHDNYEMGVAMIHDYHTKNTVNFAIANKITGKHEGASLLPFRHTSLKSAIQHITDNYNGIEKEIIK
ncbi:MAG: hypothetical protein ACTSO3_15975 [Candidatus Heimdallarchaeaceae archaeon]